MTEGLIGTLARGLGPSCLAEPEALAFSAYVVSSSLPPASSLRSLRFKGRFYSPAASGPLFLIVLKSP